MCQPLALEAIRGIGPERAKLLSKAKIRDVKAFAAADDRKLTDILGNLDVSKMKKEASSLLARANRRRRGES